MRLILSDDEVRAVLGGTKTQHRIPMGIQPYLCSPYWVGDRLWVAETFCLECSREVGWYDPPYSDGRPLIVNEDEFDGRWWTQAHYRATDEAPDLMLPDGECGCQWRSAAAMRQRYSRITLEVGRVWAQRMFEMNETDAVAEGCKPSSQTAFATGLGGFMRRWDHRYAKRGFPFADNPWVWALEVKHVTPL